MDGTDEHEPSTSVATIRGLRQLDMAFLSEPSPTSHEDHPESSPYRPSSPHSMFQSEPGSPSGDSISSFPSVSSSFHFSSGPASPPHPGQSEEEVGDLGDSTSGLVIPSLTLPAPSRKPTPYGETLGEVRLLLLGPKGLDMSAIASQLVDDNEDVVEVGIWEGAHNQAIDTRGKRTAALRVSTHWVEHRDRRGLERIEPGRNVELVELPAYDTKSEAQGVVERILPIIHAPFRDIFNLLSQEHPPGTLLAHLVSSTSSPLYTALILLATPSALLPVEQGIIESLSPHIPIVILPLPTTPLAPASSHGRPRRTSTTHLSSFQPTTIDALRSGIFRTPSILATLRSEAASRFLRWREVERAVERLHWSTRTRRDSVLSTPPRSFTDKDVKVDDIWNKQEWEAQWEDSLSQEVALHIRRRRSDPTARRMTPLSSSLSTTIPDSPSSRRASIPTGTNDFSPPCSAAAFDPLHIPSLFVFSFSLFRALKTRVVQSIGSPSARNRPAVDGGEPSRAIPIQRRGVGFTFGIGLALVGAFCTGVSIGFIAAMRL